MSFFQTYVSDTLAGSANQTYFVSDGNAHRARVYYKLFTGGRNARALLFGGTLDSTFADGGCSVCNMPCEPYTLSVKVGLCRVCDMDKATDPDVMIDATFGGNTAVTVTPDTFAATDGFVLDAQQGDFLCVELTYCGTKLPCHEELQIASFVEQNGAWIPSKKLPVPLMVGVKRAVNKRIAFLGDSITQGIGATPNSYRHWTALVADALGKQNAYDNLGIGFARSGDAASNGAWLERAKQNDIVLVCLGVNDILQGVSPDDIVGNIRTVVSLLKANGITVIVQSVPPFELFAEDGVYKQRYINAAVADCADAFFDNTPFLTANDMPIYGGHPNDDGCAVWAQALCDWLHKNDICQAALS